MAEKAFTTALDIIKYTHMSAFVAYLQQKEM
jgi:hypothetical protein